MDGTNAFTGSSKVCDARRALVVLYRGASPNVGWHLPICIAAAQVVAHPRTPLREHLEDVPVRRLHRVENLVDEGDRHCFMEKVAHRVHEDHPATLPADRLVQSLWSQGQVEARLKRVAQHTAKRLA